MANFTATYPGAGGGGGSGSNASVGPNTQPAPSSSTEVGFIDGSGNLQGVSPTNPLPVTLESEVGTLSTNVAQFGGSNVVTGTGASGAGIPRVTVSSDSTIVLPTGASTSALQTTGNSALGSILLDLTNGTQITQITGTVPLPTGSATAALQSSVQGTVAPGAAATNSNLSGMVYNSTTQAPTNGQQLSLQSDQYGNLNTDLPDLYMIGASAQTATVNNIIPGTSGATATDVLGYKSGSIQVVSTGTGGNFIFETSNDGVNFTPLNVIGSGTGNGLTISTAITATASSLIYVFSIPARYIRLRINTTITGGSIQAFSKFSQTSYAPTFNIVSQNTAANLTATVVQATPANLQVTATSATGFTTNIAINTVVADITSAAITTTTTTAAITPGLGTAFSVNIAVTAVTGTTPTMYVEIQESADGGTNWYRVYTFPVITTTGSYNSPLLVVTGNRVRYVQTLTGSSPSFTRSLNRIESASSLPPFYRNLINTTLDPTTTNAVTPTLYVENLNTYTAIINQGTGGSSVTFALDGSDDSVNWINSIATVNGVIGGTTPVPMVYSGIAYRFIRVRTVTGVAATTISSVSIIGSMGGSLSSRRGPTIDRSGSTSATPSTSTTLANANVNRNYILIQNLSSTAPIYINFTSAASATVGSFYIAPLGSYVAESGFIPTEAITVLSASASISYIAKEG